MKLLYILKIHQITEMIKLIDNSLYGHLTTIADYDNLLKERETYYDLIFNGELENETI